MARPTHVYTIEYVATLIGENLELVQEIASNSDNIDYGEMIHVAFRWKDYLCNGCDREKIQQNEAIRDWLAEHRKARTQSIIDRVNTGKQSGEIPAHVDEVAIGDCCATLLHGLSVQARDVIEPRRLHAMVDAFPIAFDSMVSAR